MKTKDFEINGSGELKLNRVDTELKSDLIKEELDEQLSKNIEKLAELQDKLYAEDTYGVLVVIQAMDTAGKDGIIKHVMSGLNPQATQVHAFKQPSAEELDHTWLWKAHQLAPYRGNIAIFNRSYYEEVLVVKVHDLLTKQKIPSEFIGKNIWEERYKDIRNYEDYLTRNGIVIVKLFLNISKEEQKNRLLERIDDKSKNWKFSDADLKEREYWDKYMDCYQDMINGTSTKDCPWYVIPADKKKLARLLVSNILIEKLCNLDLRYPELEESKLKMLSTYKKQLENEK